MDGKRPNTELTALARQISAANVGGGKRGVHMLRINQLWPKKHPPCSVMLRTATLDLVSRSFCIFTGELMSFYFPRAPTISSEGG